MGCRASEDARVLDFRLRRDPVEARAGDDACESASLGRAGLMLLAVPVAVVAGGTALALFVRERR
jgi:hypothetical protein